ILAATTFPGHSPETGTVSACIVCGERGLADALLNILLFAPFGAALAFLRVRTRHIVVAAALLSGLVETAQLVAIPGRDPSIGDILFNTLGAAVGVAAFTSAGWWLAPKGPSVAALGWAWSAVVAAVMLGTGVLLSPSPTGSNHYGQWTPELGHLEWYRGRVIEARIGTSPLPWGRIEDPGMVYAMLLGSERLWVRAVAGPPPSGLVPVVAVQDQSQREILLLGIDRDDLVLRYRTRSSALRLDQPDLRATGALRDVAPGDSMVIAAWRQDRSHCLGRDGEVRCGIGFTAGRGWSILMYPGTLPSPLVRFLDVAWIAVLFVPLGFWIRSTRSLPALLPAGFALLVAPSVTGLLATPPVEIAMAIVAVVCGTLAGRQMSRGSR
ncbi:MAG TPA: VanZ family protein, partial [Gemmatimonadaceae bacterium]|nr:VanZ family protein [Gemmatimonadaceae bacterium]